MDVLPKLLSRWSISTQELEYYVLDEIHNNPTMLVGSIPYGLGNKTSDVDILAVGPSDYFKHIVPRLPPWASDPLEDARRKRNTISSFYTKPQASFEAVDTRGVPTDGEGFIGFRRLKAGARLNVEVISLNAVQQYKTEVRDYIARADAWIEGRSPVPPFGILSTNSILILSRMYAGFTVRGEDSIRSILSDLPVRAFLDACALHENILIIATIEDIRGVIDAYPSGEECTKIMLARNMVERVVSQILYLGGCPHPGGKIIFRLLDNPKYAIPKSTAEVLCDIYRSIPYANDDVDLMKVVERIMDVKETIHGISPLYDEVTRRMHRALGELM